MARPPPVEGRIDVPWGELTEKDYATKTASFDSSDRRTMCSDVEHVHRGNPDPEGTDQMAALRVLPCIDGERVQGGSCLSEPRPEPALCGHSREQRVVQREGLTAANCNVGGEPEGPMTSTVRTPGCSP